MTFSYLTATRTSIRSSPIARIRLESYRPTRSKRHLQSFQSVQVEYTHLFSSADAASTPESSDDSETTMEDGNDIAPSEDSKTSKKSLMTSIKQYFQGPQDGLTMKQRLAKMGLAAALSYGWVSNMSGSVCVSIAWYIFSKRVRTVVRIHVKFKSRAR
jgi:hypothetical protein